MSEEDGTEVQLFTVGALKSRKWDRQLKYENGDNVPSDIEICDKENKHFAKQKNGTEVQVFTAHVLNKRNKCKKAALEALKQ